LETRVVAAGEPRGCIRKSRASRTSRIVANATIEDAEGRAATVRSKFLMVRIIGGTARLFHRHRWHRLVLLDGAIRIAWEARRSGQLRRPLDWDYPAGLTRAVGPMTRPAKREQHPNAEFVIHRNLSNHSRSAMSKSKIHSSRPPTCRTTTTITCGNCPARGKAIRYQQPGVLRRLLPGWRRAGVMDMLFFGDSGGTPEDYGGNHHARFASAPMAAPRDAICMSRVRQAWLRDHHVDHLSSPIPHRARL